MALDSPPGAAMDGYWRRGHDFIAIAENTARLDNNSQLLDTLFDMSVNIHFFQFGDPGRTLGNVETSVRIVYLCSCYSNCSLARNNQYSKGCGVFGSDERD